MGVLEPTDLEVVKTINALHRCLPARGLVDCLRFYDCFFY